MWTTWQLLKNWSQNILSNPLVASWAMGSTLSVLGVGTWGAWDGWVVKKMDGLSLYFQLWDNKSNRCYFHFKCRADWIMRFMRRNIISKSLYLCFKSSLWAVFGSGWLILVKNQCMHVFIRAQLTEADPGWDTDMLEAGIHLWAAGAGALQHL